MNVKTIRELEKQLQAVSITGDQELTAYVVEAVQRAARTPEGRRCLPLALIPKEHRPL
jgi:hypothetical protein